MDRESMHAIRLRGPWEFSLGCTNVSGRVDFPCTWQKLLSAASAWREPADWNSVTLRRRFHRPTGLAANDRLVLSLLHVGQELIVRLNGTALSPSGDPDGTLQFDITSQLADHNELEVQLAPPSPPLLDSTVPVLEATLAIHSV